MLAKVAVTRADDIVGIRNGGTGFGYAMEPAVTADGSRRLTVSIFTNTFDPDLAAPRFTALRQLIDHALCH